MTSMVPCPGKSSAVNTITGQCQRYQEYEVSPMYTIGRVARRALTPAVWCVPPRMRSMVPTTGSRASSPGNTMVSWMTRAPTARITAPRAPVSIAADRDRTGIRSRTRASRAPAANSQARVKGE